MKSLFKKLNTYPEGLKKKIILFCAGGATFLLLVFWVILTSIFPKEEQQNTGDSFELISGFVNTISNMASEGSYQDDIFFTEDLEQQTQETLDSGEIPQETLEEVVQETQQGNTEETL